MRALAERAQVSSRTPYNLFGSKTDVLLAMLDAPLAEMARSAPPMTTDVLVTLVALAEGVVSLYAPQVDYYRQIYWGVMSSEQHESRVKTWQRAKLFILPIILRAQDNGELGPIDAGALVDYVVTSLAGLLGLWASNLLTNEQLVNDSKRSLGFCFLSCCTDKVRAQITQALPPFTSV